MKTQWIRSGSRGVAISTDCGHISARLYVNGGDTATPSAWEGKTLAGAVRWAFKKLGLVAGREELPVSKRVTTMSVMEYANMNGWVFQPTWRGYELDGPKADQRYRCSTLKQCISVMKGQGGCSYSRSSTGSEVSEVWSIVSNLTTGMRIDDPSYPPARDWLNRNRKYQILPQNTERSNA